MYRTKPAFTVPLYLLPPTTQKINGVLTKTYPNTTDGILFYGSFKTYGGTETAVNGLLSIVDTAEIETWYRPEIKADCLVVVASTNQKYEIISEPENINMENRFLKFKVRATKGGA